MTTDQRMFFDKLPQMLSVYEILKEKLDTTYPDMKIKVSKTQITFRNRYGFVMVSLPWKRSKGGRSNIC